MRTSIWVAVLAAASLFSGGVLADEMLMKNGSRLIGKVVSAADGKIKFDTDFAGTIDIDSDDVDTVYTEEEVTIMMNDGRLFENKRIAARDNALVVMNENNEAVAFEAQDMKRLNPEPWELGRGYKWTGDVKTAMVLERGNTETDEFDLNWSTRWRSLKDRFRMSGYYELDEADGIRNKNKWRWRNYYDRFSVDDPDNYYGMLLAFEGDEFSDLDLRTRVGPYLGRQFIERDWLDLSGEVGLVWVDERLDLSEEQEAAGEDDQNDYPGSVWALQATSDIVGFGSELYIDHDGTVNFDDADALLLNTTIGIRFKLYKGLQAGVEARYEYDGGVADDRDEMDETYNLFLGYAW
jgi:hypothetical protein